MDYLLRSKTRGGTIFPINPEILRVSSNVDYATGNGEDFLKVLLSKAAENNSKIPVSVLLLRKQIPDIDKAWPSIFETTKRYLEELFRLLPESDIPHIRRALIERNFKLVGDNILID